MFKILSLAFVMFVSPFVVASETNDDITTVTNNLKKAIPNLQIEAINATPIANLFELVSNNRVYYISKDARYLINGIMLDMVENKNITQVTMDKLEENNKVDRVALLKTLNKDEFLVFPAKGKTKHFISVFTDVTCPFCGKLHKEVPTLNNNGIEVRYMLYPRDFSRVGKRSPSYQTMVSVWCADDPQQALSDAKLRKSIKTKTCDNPLLKHIKLANQMGLSGTPMIILDDGTLIEGYVPASKLLTLFKN